MKVGNRKRQGDLTIVLLAQLAAKLPCNPNRMPPILGKPVSSMIQASIGPLAFDLRQHNSHLAKPAGPMRVSRIVSMDFSASVSNDFRGT